MVDDIKQCSAMELRKIQYNVDSLCIDTRQSINDIVIVSLNPEGTEGCFATCFGTNLYGFEKPEAGVVLKVGVSTFEPLDHIKKGNKVLTAGLNLEWKDIGVIEEVTHRDVKQLVHLEYGNNKQINIPFDHMLLANGLKNFIPAGKITPDDVLFDSNGYVVKIKKISLMNFKGKVTDISLSGELNDNFDGHLLNTNGIISGDKKIKDSYKLVNKFSQQTQPEIGSKEYIEKYGDLLDPDLKPNHEKKFEISQFEDEFTIPEDATNFLNPSDASKEQGNIKMGLGISAHERGFAISILKHYKNLYPDVEFHLDWSNNEVNAYAYTQNGVQHVAILGGLVKHPAIKVEALSLIIAHELGHHTGETPTYKNSIMSCEWKSDAVAVAEIMRKAHWAKQYLEVVPDAIAQMAEFFHVANRDLESPRDPGCSHPPGDYRIATYKAAMQLDNLPIHDSNDYYYG